MDLQEKELELRKIRSRIEWMCKDKIAAFSATISPAPKSAERKEIESLYEGVRYYVENGVKDLVFQQKYMGSYCDIYLHKDMDNTYFVSRNGYKIDSINLTEAKLACEDLYSIFDWTDLELVIVQAELLPWHVMGGRLIEREFDGYLKAHQTRLDYYKSSGLLAKTQRVKEGQAFTEFLSDRKALSGKAVKKKYPAHIVRQFDALAAFEPPELQSYAEGTEVYERQIRYYGKEGDLYFKPFNILKKIYADGREEIPNDNLTYSQVNPDEMKVVHIDNVDELQEKLVPVYGWYNALCREMAEGIVIKPQKAFVKGVVPALKVRNNDYLTMIYGIDFLQDMETQIRKRKTGNKMVCSMNDWQINFALLQIPYQDIRTENYYYKNLMLDRILQEKAELKLDPSL
ncbi:DNA ligase-like domain-containing protein [Arachidicoccus terrestris]|uniref:hypothetical protein n=1 Tax=Arachidicoccus terrestris TaxID=2875539 RepID=UPI001CC75753|nr:hypothetical protein [Arachidicoccus terrestris]UAY53974.1 hypothetical protein K9M52_10875 [Arachidicoccus terrestris]